MINHLKDFRATIGISQAELSRTSGVSRRTINRIERGLAVEPEMDTMIRIAMGLGAKVDDVFEIEPFGECDRCGRSNYLRKVVKSNLCPDCRKELATKIMTYAHDLTGQDFTPEDLIRLMTR